MSWQEQSSMRTMESESVAETVRRRTHPRSHPRIAQHIQMLSAGVLTIEEGSLYPALQRILVKGWVSADWKISANNRRAPDRGLPGHRARARLDSTLQPARVQYSTRPAP